MKIKNLLVGLAIIGIGAAGATPARAGISFGISLGFPCLPHVVLPPPPVCLAPPVVFAPPAVVCGPPAVYCPPRYVHSHYYYGPGYRGAPYYGRPGYYRRY